MVCSLQVSGSPPRQSSNISCFPELFSECFLVRFDSQQHWPKAQNEKEELSCLTKPIPTPPLSQTDISPVVRIGPGAVEQCHKWSSAPADGVQGQCYPIHRGEHEEGECKDERLVVLLPYTAVNPPKRKKILFCLKRRETRLPCLLPAPQPKENLISKVLLYNTGS